VAASLKRLRVDGRKCENFFQSIEEEAMSREVVVKCDFCKTVLAPDYHSPWVIGDYAISYCGRNITFWLGVAGCGEEGTGSPDICPDCLATIEKAVKDRVWQEMEESKSLED
jgi:hypothetical protein